MGNLDKVKRMLDPSLWTDAAQYRAWLACMVEVGRYMDGGNADGTRWALEFVPGTGEWKLEVVLAEFERAAVGEVSAEARLLRDLVEEVRGLRQVVEALQEGRRPKPVIISRETVTGPEWLDQIRAMMGWG